MNPAALLEHGTTALRPMIDATVSRTGTRGEESADLMRVCPHRNAESPCKAEICQLQIVILVDEEILRLKVAMQYAMRVAVQQP